MEELGLGDEFRWVETKTGFYTDGQLVSMSNTVEFLKFPPLSLFQKLRLGATIFAASRIKDWKKLETIRVEDWLIRLSGRKTFDKIWRPLLKAKLGEAYKDTSAAFIWATIQRMYAARRSGMKTELFGYVRGGYARVLERFGEVLLDNGVEIRLNAKVESVEKLAGGSIRVATVEARRYADIKPTKLKQEPKYATFRAAAAVARGFSGAFLAEPNVTAGRLVNFPRSKTTESFDRVILTCPSGIAADLVSDLTNRERLDLKAIRYQGIVCASVLLRCSLSDFYVTNITDEMPFTGVIEMTSLVDKKEFGHNALVYLPKYVASNDPIFEKSDGEIEQEFLDGLMHMFPRFKQSDLIEFKVSRVRQVFPIPVLNYSRDLPESRTSVDAVYIVNSSHIVNGTLNVNETVQLAERFVEELKMQN